MGKSGTQKAGKFDSNADRHSGSSPIHGAVAMIGGGLLSGGFYAVVFASSWAPLERYFLGHPVAIAATVLFCIAVSILAIKFWSVQTQWGLLRRANDQALAPKTIEETPTGEYRTNHDAGYVARGWSADLAKLPRSVGGSKLVHRLREVLTRQSGRGTTKHLSDDLRELSSRDADTAHDSFALIRIIVWAIPMLGFLGTVIGITQTLGGLDFSNGQAAVDNLKSGLYVAFDTTALGLVLSIVAIFLQFPVERSEQRLLAAIDERVGLLTGRYLPGDEAADNQLELLANLCEGVRTAVAESLSQQTTLWRQTIDAAQEHWQAASRVQAESLIDAVEGTLTPALRDHAGKLMLATHDSRKLMDSQFRDWQAQLSTWQETVVAGAEAMVNHQASLLDQVDQAALIREQATSVLQLQQTLAANLELLHQSNDRVVEANQRIDENIGAAAGQGMADAMMILAQAVDVLAVQMATNDSSVSDQSRRAA